MTHAERCPVCGGSGKIKREPHPDSTGSGYEESCYGCFGKGWVEVSDQYNPWGSPYYPASCPTLTGGVCHGDCPYCPYRITVTYRCDYCDQL